MLSKIKNYFNKSGKIVHFIAPALILTFMFFISFFSSNGAFGIPGDSCTFDEIIHIPAGYNYAKHLEFKYNSEHPPLGKALSGISMVLAGIEAPVKDELLTDPMKIIEDGQNLIYKNRDSAEKILMWARLPMILLTIALGAILYKWAAKIYGMGIGLLVLTLFAFYPDIIGHGRIVATDIPVTFGYVIAVYFFDIAINRLTWKNILLAGIALGVAELLKFSAILLYGILFFLVIIRAFMDKNENKGFFNSFWLYFKPYFWISLISFIFVIIVYTLSDWRTPAQTMHKMINATLTEDPQTLPYRKFLYMFEGSPLTMGLGHYIMGLMLIAGRVYLGNFTFILGHFSLKAISWYFPVAWLLKTPITIIVLTLSSLWYVVFRFPKEKKDRWTIALILVPLAVYYSISMAGSLNIGIRHLLPTVPFILLLIGFFCWKIFQAREGWTAPKIAAFILLAYMAVSTLSYYPEYIAYFNEATPRDKRHTRLVDSSLDWGQDLYRLKKYLNDNNIKNIKLDYFGTAVPAYYISDFKIWDSEYGPATGWLAISAIYYQASKLRGEFSGKWSYHWLDSRKPAAVIGGSILVFNIDENDLKKNPPESPYKITNIVRPYTGRKYSIIWDIVEYSIKQNLSRQKQK